MPIPNAPETILGSRIVDELVSHGYNPDRISLVIMAMRDRAHQLDRERFREGRRLSFVYEGSTNKVTDVRSEQDREG
jgi:hypothetical protein